MKIAFQAKVANEIFNKKKKTFAKFKSNLFSWELQM